MRCRKARTRLSDLHNGELSEREERALLDHLERCSECAHIRAEFDAAMMHLADAELPEPPEGFESELHMKLVRESERMKHRPDPWIGDLWFRFRPVLSGAALLACGALAMFLILTLGSSGPAGALLQEPVVRTAQKDVDRAFPGRGLSTEPKTAAGLPLNKVAVLTLMVHSSDRLTDVRFQVVLPDGVAFVGESRKVLEERVMTWSGTLEPGQNRVQIPVRAQRAGRWLMVARATKGQFKFVTEQLLVVTRG